MQDVILLVHPAQDILDEFLRCELYYHCRALEMLAPALLHIEGVDAESAREASAATDTQDRIPSLTVSSEE